MFIKDTVVRSDPPLEDTHKRKSDGVIIDPRTIQILDEVKKKVDEQLSQMECRDGFEPVQPKELSKAEMDALFKSVLMSITFIYNI